MHWVFVVACGLSLTVTSRGYSSLWFMGTWASVVAACQWEVPKFTFIPRIFLSTYYMPGSGQNIRDAVGKGQTLSLAHGPLILERKN